MRMGGGKRMGKLVVIHRQRRVAVPNPALTGLCRSGSHWAEPKCAPARPTPPPRWFRVGAEPIEDGRETDDAKRGGVGNCAIMAKISDDGDERSERVA